MGRLRDIFEGSPLGNELHASLCQGKQGYDSPKLAIAVATRSKHNLCHYRCQWCGKYHVGSKQK